MEKNARAGWTKKPEILSTHPANQTRIDNLTEWGPSAIALAKKNQLKRTLSVLESLFCGSKLYECLLSKLPLKREVKNL